MKKKNNIIFKFVYMQFKAKVFLMHTFLFFVFIMFSSKAFEGMPTLTVNTKYSWITFQIAT